MAKKRIFSVGFEIPHDDVENVEIESNSALLDADIILFRPVFPFDHCTEFQGRPCYSDRGSEKVRTAIGHWRTQLQEAAKSGKTIVILLDRREEIFVATGEIRTNGTGRNARQSRIVDSADSYALIPFSLGKVIAANGKSVKLADGDNWLRPMYEDLAGYLEYQVYVEDPSFKVLMHTPSGQKAVGGIIEKIGSVLVFPSFAVDEEDFTTEDQDKNLVWTPEAIVFGGKLVASLIAVDELCKTHRLVTPPPEWIAKVLYRFSAEIEAENHIAQLQRQIEKLQDEIAVQRKDTETYSSLKRALYEKGKPLEEAVRECLLLLGFDVSHFVDEGSEFDALFSSEEGRFLGEFEGKDNKAINIDKFSQLERNINEDFSREEVTEHAKGVLFGNAFRLSDPSERGEYFTTKVYSAAKRTGVALVRTPDLFKVAQYLKENSDNEFGKSCREAIASTAGSLVVFPDPPTSTNPASREIETQEDTKPASDASPR